MSNYSTHEVLNAIAAAQKALSDRKDEVNRLNVFCVENVNGNLQTVSDSHPIGSRSRAKTRPARTRMHPWCFKTREPVKRYEHLTGSDSKEAKVEGHATNA